MHRQINTKSLLVCTLALAYAPLYACTEGMLVEPEVLAYVHILSTRP